MGLGTKFKQTLLKVQGKNFSIQNLASGYDKISAGYTDIFNRNLQEFYYDLFKPLGEINNKKILDLGCGTAWLGKLLFANSSPLFYHGIDISTGMVYQARQNLKEYTGIKIEHGDFQESLRQLPQESYDIIFLTWSLKFSKIETLLSQALRVLKTGGKLALLTETDNSGEEINTALEQLLITNINSLNFAFPKTFLPHNSRQLTELLNRAGFRQTIVWEKSRTDEFTSIGALITWAEQNGLLAVWDEILNLKDADILEQLRTLIKPTEFGQFQIKRKFLGAVARK